jgi:hypothetical protein
MFLIFCLILSYISDDYIYCGEKQCKDYDGSNDGWNDCTWNAAIWIGCAIWGDSIILAGWVILLLCAVRAGRVILGDSAICAICGRVILTNSVIWISSAIGVIAGQCHFILSIVVRANIVTQLGCFKVIRSLIITAKY